MGAKVQFITPDKLIQPTIAPDTDGVISIDFHVDVFSDGKEDWLGTDDLNTLKFPMSVEGGVDVATGTLGRTFILGEGWHLTPYAANHSFTVTGNVYTADGSPLMIFDSDYSVAVEYITTLTPPGLGLTPEQANAVEFDVFGGAVLLKLGGTTNSTFPAGTAASPVGDVNVAKSIAVSRGFDTIRVAKGAYIFTSDHDISSYLVAGAGVGGFLIMQNPICQGTHFEDVHMSGTVTGSDMRIEHSAIGSSGLVGFEGTLDNVTLLGDVTVTENAAHCHIINCHSGIPGTDHPSINMNSDGAGLGIRSYEGGIGVSNWSNAAGKISIDLVSGQIFIDSDVTAGSVTCRGVGQITNNATSDVSVGTTYLVDGTVKRSVINKQTLDSDGLLTVYDNDGVTVLLQQTLTDKDGNAITLDAGTPAQRTKNA